MITNEEALDIGFSEEPKGFHSPANVFVGDDFLLRLLDGKVTLGEWERDEEIDISHLNAEQVKILISLLTKPKGYK